MLTQIFEQTTAITSTAVEVFNSETYLGGILDGANSVFLGVSIANTGSASAQIQVEIKTHPNGAWITHTSMAGTYSITNSANLSNSFYRQVFGISSGAIAANSSGLLVCNIKFVYAIRIQSRMATGASGNSIRIRGNVKIPTSLNYEEKSVQQMTVATVTAASVPTWVDVSEHAFMSSFFSASGSNPIQSMAAGIFPALVANSGNVAVIRYYPGDTAVVYLDVNTSAISLGDKTDINIQSAPITASIRTTNHRYFVEAAYEIGFLWNVPGGSTVDYYISLNG